MTLAEKQCEFSLHLAKLVIWINEQGWKVSIDETMIHTPRPVQIGVRRTVGEDRRHRKGSFHHKGLAADLDLFIEGDYIEDGSHPAWQAIGAKWISMHPDATWGSAWNDSNHVSWQEKSP